MRALALVVACLSGCMDMRAAAIVGPLRTDDAPEPGRPMELVAGDGTRLHGFAVLPDGRARGTVLLLHGQGARAAFWRDEAIALADAGYLAVAWDQRGHGRSGGLCTYGAYEAGDVSTVLDALASARLLVAPIVLYGYSMGGAIAIQAAAREPRIGGVLAVAPFATLDAILRRVAWGFPTAQFDDVMRAAERRARFRIADVRPIDDARRVRVPMVLVAGTFDTTAPLAEVQAIAAAAGRHGELVVVPGGRHDSLLPRCGAACSSALERLLGPPPSVGRKEPRRGPQAAARPPTAS